MKNIVRKSYFSTHIFLEQNIVMTNAKPSLQSSAFKQPSISIFTKIISAKNSRHKIYFYIAKSSQIWELCYKLFKGCN